MRSQGAPSLQEGGPERLFFSRRSLATCVDFLEDLARGQAAGRLLALDDLISEIFDQRAELLALLRTHLEFLQRALNVLHRGSPLSRAKRC